MSPRSSTLPAPQIEPFSFLSLDLLQTIKDHLDLTADSADTQILADLGCGRRGPGLWLAAKTGTTLIGVDFSLVALQHAAQRALGAGQERARFVLCHLTATSIAENVVDAAVSIDALQFPPDRHAAIAEPLRILRPGGRLVLTGWHPITPGDQRLPPRHRDTDWPASLTTAGVTNVRCHTAPRWNAIYQGIYRTALACGEPGDDVALAALQDEARAQLPTAHLLRRVMVTATAASDEPQP